MSTYIIAIGGTGAKVVETVVHLAAAGIYPQDLETEDLQILFVDQDRGNGHTTAADRALNSYRKCSETIKGRINEEYPWWMKTKVEQFQGGGWSLFNEPSESLKDAFRYEDYRENSTIRNLFDVLYTKEEREISLKDGFVGRPAIGSAIMTKMTQEQVNRDNWTALIDEIEADCRGGGTSRPKIFLCGSIFGGMGASGFPTLGRLIVQELGEEGRNVLNDVKLGGLLMLPYFQFKSSGEKQVQARSEEFILRTEAALRYYETQGLKFDTVYLLGTPSLTMVNKFSTGGGDQRNPPLFLELYGGLALRDFLLKDKPQQRNVVLLNRQSSRAVTWEDIPERNEVKAKLVNAAHFAHAWISAIDEDLKYARQKFRDVRWAKNFFNSDQIQREEYVDEFNAISGWCEEYLKWLFSLHHYGNGVNWFNATAFASLEKNEEIRLKRDRNEFSNLVKSGSGKQINDILKQLRKTNNIEAENKGTVGLAKALYLNICQNI
ncbi:MAG: hypothetical protein QNJ55_32030 [Xenococcus sp. MO_188.B8]|nr:hypothetical protein [Xenococcus sp. MO_188.B8]